ncbi:hypothetical protein [Rhodococcoides yunnanense]|uniref:hypothetical protein n=1 Tax=Rhodococcoides yunnanense TaxID=278209 RepID=UPI000A902F43|nr:hypothetical protein [Rhodococcus yunnanensis]
MHAVEVTSRAVPSHALAQQVPYWVAVLTPEERPFGTRRTDPFIDTVDSSVVTTTRTQWAGTERPSATTLLAVLAATAGAWQTDRCRTCTSGVLVDISSESDSASEGNWGFYPVRLPSTGPAEFLTREVRRRVEATPAGGRDFRTAKYTLNAPALARRSGAQISFDYRPEHPVLDHPVLEHPALEHPESEHGVPDESRPLNHSLSVTCEVVEVDGVMMVDTEFRWNCRIFTRSDVDDFERFWEKTIPTFC